MSIFTYQYWIWPALALAFSFGVMVTRWVLAKKNSQHDHTVSQEYFKGLNFVLNEEPDKAIEVFIKALEVDSETVELHLALGGLFRRKGQVDRATRIHQNLIARPSLTEDQRLQAIYELAQDYYHAGLLDRAENLFLELKESMLYRYQAIEGLCSIYQKEKEWMKAIDVTRLHGRSQRSGFARRVAHYWCELAQSAISNNELDEARKYLRSALAEDRSAGRAVLLQGELSFQKQDYVQALKLWQSLSVSNPILSELFVGKIICCYQKLEDSTGLKDYLLNLSSIPKDADGFSRWSQSLVTLFGEDRAIEQIFSQVKQDGLSRPVANFLFDITEKEKIPKGVQEVLFKDLLSRAKSNNIEYTCAGCGFDTKAMHWLCPSCGEWDSFS